MSVAKWGGRAAVAASVASSAYNVATSDNKARTLVTEGSSTLGAVGGAAVGAKVGAAIGTLITPGIGTGIGAVVGGIVGGIAGAIAGDKAGGSLFDAIW